MLSMHGRMQHPLSRECLTRVSNTRYSTTGNLGKRR